MEKKTRLSLSEKKAYWQAIFKEWETSGLSQSAFCRTHAITPSQFYNWRKRLEEARALAGNTFAPVTLKQEVPERVKPTDVFMPLVLIVKNNVRLEITANTDAKALKMVLVTLGLLSC